MTEERWRELHDLKEPGQTYDDLLAELVEEHKKARLFRDMDRIREEREFEPLDEVTGRMGDGYEVLVSQEVRELLDALDEKSERIVRENLAKLTEPHSGQGQGDKERITWRDREVYRLHIGRTWTAFYDVEDDDGVVYVLRVMPIDDAHKEYGGLDCAESSNVRIADHASTERHQCVSRSTRSNP